jgi:hypothetical protein
MEEVASTLWHTAMRGHFGKRHFVNFLINALWALAAWRSGHCIRLKNEKTRVRIPPGYKVFRET